MLSKLTLVGLLLLGAGSATPELAFPINSQFPPVAYVLQPYKLEIALTTFVSPLPQVVYAITGGPTWLQLDNGSRLLTGIPLQEDVGTNTFQLTASDSTGETSTTVTLMVLSEPSVLTPNTPLLPQLETAGPVSAPHSLILHPSQPFEVIFPPETFHGISPNTKYYAALENHSPLPSWIQFDPSQLSFKGTSPPLIPRSPASQTYGLVMMASNIPDFTQAMVQFDIIVSDNILAFTAPIQQYNISGNARFETPSLRSSLLLNGKAITDVQVANVTTDAPDWLKLDKSQIVLSGSAPDTADINVTISVTDTYNDVANTTIQILHKDLVTSPIGKIATIRITLGREFSYNVNESRFVGPGQMTVNLGDTSSWLHFDAQRRTLSGLPPLSLPASTVTIPVTFKNGTADIRATVDLQPALREIEASDTSTLRSLPTTTPRPGTINNSYNTGAQPNKTPSRRVTTIILAMLAVACGLLTIFCLVLWVMRRRRGQRKVAGEQELSSGESQRRESTTRECSEPTTAPLPVQRGGPQNPISMQPPSTRIDSTWPNEAPEGPRYSSAGTANRPSIHDSRLAYKWGPLNNHPFQGNLPPRDAMSEKLPPSKQQARTSVTHEPSGSKIETNERGSSTLSRQSRSQSIIGLPNRRSGAGHGNGLMMDSNANKDLDIGDLHPPLDSRRTTMVLDSFPNPPQDGSKTAKVRSLNKPANPSLRVTSEDSNLSFEARRQQWHTERARARLEGGARFSNAGSSFALRTPRDPPGRRSVARYTQPLSLLSLYGSSDRPASREPSWSRWSGMGPPAQETLRAASPLDSLIENLPGSKRSASLMSDGQFDSAASSDSQWEFEDLIDEDRNETTRHCQTNGQSITTPRLPFDTVRNSRQSTSSETLPTHPGRARLSDVRRKHFSVADGELKSYQSHHGNFRFI